MRNFFPPIIALFAENLFFENNPLYGISISICHGKFVIEVYDKDNFNFNIVNYPYMCSNIPARPTYNVYISQLIRINRICDKFNTFVKRHRLLTEKLIRQGFWYSKLCNSFKKNC